MRVRTGFVRMIGLAALVAVSLPGRSTAEELRGTVVDRAGKPAGGAKVRAAKLSFMELRDVRETTADGSGAFVVNVSPGPWNADEIT